MDKTPELHREAIKTWQAVQDNAQQQINALAKRAIPDFHFLNHQVSTFWDCEQSPIGLCVWNISERGFNIDCRCYYCGGPVERK